MSSSPIQIKNSLSHELALTLFTRPEEAKQAFEEQKTRIKPAHRAGWKRYFDNPEKYNQVVTAHALGMGLTRGGEWMSGYTGHSAIPAGTLFSNKTKPENRIRVKTDASPSVISKLKTKLKTINEMASKLSHDNIAARQYRSTASETRREIDNLTDGVYKWVSASDYMENHEKYREPLEVHEPHFKASIATYMLTVNPTVKDKLAGHNVNYDDSISPKALMNMVEIVMGQSVDNHKGIAVGIGSEMHSAKQPVVIKNPADLHFLMYPLNDPDGKMSDIILLQDVRTNNVAIASPSALMDNPETISWVNVDPKPHSIDFSQNHLPEVNQITPNTPQVDVSNDNTVSPTLRR